MLVATFLPLQIVLNLSSFFSSSPSVRVGKDTKSESLSPRERAVSCYPPLYPAKNKIRKEKGFLYIMITMLLCD